MRATLELPGHLARAMIARFVLPMTLALVLGLPSVATAQDFPTLTRPVNDFINVIDAKSAAELDRLIRALESQTPTRDAIVVVTIATFQPWGSIEDYATRLFEKAGIGKKGRDNGLLILVARDDRQVRIEVGYDLEEFIPDGFAGDVIRQDFLPAFRKNAYGEGLVQGTTRIINRIAEKRGVTLTDVPKVVERQDDVPWPMLVPFAIVVIVIILRIIGAAKGGGPRRRGPWGGFGGIFGGGFGGGFGGFGSRGSGGGGWSSGGGSWGGFGGGMSGGGGASGRW